MARNRNLRETTQPMRFTSLVRVEMDRGLGGGLFLIMQEEGRHVTLAPWDWETGVGRERVVIYKAHTYSATVEERRRLMNAKP